MRNIAILLTVFLLFGLTACAAAPATTPAPTAAPAAAPAQKLSVGALKGPTAMGLVQLMDKAGDQYGFTLAATADELVALFAKGEIDAAALPCNLSSVLFNNTKGALSVAAINTLGVLYVVEAGDTVTKVADLKGQTVMTTGKGTTPEFALNHVLAKNGLVPGVDVTVEFASEAAEVAASLAEGKVRIAMLPQPFVTTALNKNDKLRVALDLSKEWDAVAGGESSLVTGVLVVRNAFIQEHPGEVRAFMDAYAESARFVSANPEAAAPLVEKYGIVPAAVAKAAIPQCNIVFIEGPEMKTKVSGYLKALFDQEPKSVGGALPGDAFYYAR